MKSRRTLWLRTLATALVSLVMLTAPLAGQKKDQKFEERFRAVAVGTGHTGIAAGRATTVDITINRWTTEKEREEILAVLATNDGGKIRSFLEDLPSVGRINLRGRRGEDLRYAFEFEEGGQRTLVVASDRPLASISLLNDPGVEYLVAVAVLRLDQEGNGTGNLSPAIELRMVEGRLEVVASAADPLTFTRVTRR